MAAVRGARNGGIEVADGERADPFCARLWRLAKMKSQASGPIESAHNSQSSPIASLL